MGLLQKARETYQYHRNLVGKIEDDKEPLAPCSHMAVRADVEITVNQDGKFVSAAVRDKQAPKVLIPVTENSAGRSGRNPQPHPLCDQLVYLAPYDENKHKLYIDQLKDWTQSEFSHPKLIPILQYVQGETIINDLLNAGIIQLKDGKPNKEKLMICWIVVGLGLEDSGPCWNDATLFSSFDRYYRSKKCTEPQILCMLTGDYDVSAKQHLKGVVPAHGNAKLISSNDSSNFTYRGRFTSPYEAETVGYEASQKAHNALRWLIANQGVSLGGRFFICWEPHQITLPSPIKTFLPQLRDQDAPSNFAPSDYQLKLKNTLKGWQNSLPESAQAVIAALDAATSGRLAVTYYNELQASDFLERLCDWDAHCCWLGGRHGEFGVQSPSIWQIVNCTFGTQRKEKMAVKLTVDDRVMKQQAQRLVACRIDQSKIPADFVKQLTRRCSAPQSYEPEIWEKILFTACAVIKKYRYDQYKEEWDMALDPQKQDRSYQYGRLLAVLEKIERDTYGPEEKREPNAIRMMSVFMQRPQYVANLVGVRVKTAYYPKLLPNIRIYYDKILQEIYEMISECGECETNRPLGETCLMGYYLQRRELYRKKENGGKEE